MKIWATYVSYLCCCLCMFGCEDSMYGTPQTRDTTLLGLDYLEPVQSASNLSLLGSDHVVLAEKNWFVSEDGRMFFSEPGANGPLFADSFGEIYVLSSYQGTMFTFAEQDSIPPEPPTHVKKTSWGKIKEKFTRE